MGKKVSASPRELEIIFSCFVRGDSVSKIQEELEYNSYDKRDVRYINEMSREFEACRRVLEIELKKQITPQITKAWEEHFNLMAEIALSLIDNGLSSIMIAKPDKQGDKQPIEYQWGKWEKEQGIDEETMKNILDDNMYAACRRYSPHKVKCFLDHLWAELPNEKREGTDVPFLGREDTNLPSSGDPYKVIDRCRILSERKTFEGLCPVCKVWWDKLDRFFPKTPKALPELSPKL